MSSDVAHLIGQVTKRGLCGHAHRAAVEGLGAEHRSSLRIECRHKVRCGGPRLGLGLAHHDVDPVPEPEDPSHPVSSSSQISDRLGNGLERVGPHQVDIGASGGHVASRIGEPAEVERRPSSAIPSDARWTQRPRRPSGQQIVELRHDAGCSDVAGFGRDHFAGEW